MRNELDSLLSTFTNEFFLAIIFTTLNYFSSFYIPFNFISLPVKFMQVYLLPACGVLWCCENLWLICCVWEDLSAEIWQGWAHVLQHLL